MRMVSWFPWDRHLNAMRAKARNNAARLRKNRRVRPFGGSIEGGLAIKKTLRSEWKGKKEYFVISNALKRRQQTGDSREPIVWIFTAKVEQECQVFAWDTFGAPGIVSALAALVQEKVEYPEHGEEGKSAKYITRQQFAGLTTFLDFSIDGTKLKDEYGSAEYRKRLPTSDAIFPIQNVQPWTKALLRAAIEFAQDVALCVLPNNFEIPPDLVQRSMDLGRAFRRIPLESFSSTELRKLMNCFTVRVQVDSDEPDIVNAEAVRIYHRLMKARWG
jgi:hypothetical protein